jgi:hypothetical protein
VLLFGFSAILMNASTAWLLSRSGDSSALFVDGMFVDRVGEAHHRLGVGGEVLDQLPGAFCFLLVLAMPMIVPER